MSREKTRKMRITIVVPDRMAALVDQAEGKTGLSACELGRMGLVKVLNELGSNGKIEAESLPEVLSA